MFKFENLKIITILILLLTSFNCLGQSKSETELWIKKLYNTYKLDTEKKNELLFAAGDIFQMKHPGYGCGVWSSIPLKDIVFIEIIENDFKEKNVVTINLFSNTANSINNKTHFINSKVHIINEMSFNLKPSFIAQGFKEKMGNALVDLIELKGGNAIIK